jgi:2',3'-cyclic-nucleotide 2'-phosphodiesterase (5'-nucleotidase family)
VATIRKELLAKNPNTVTVLAGDFISPSVTGTLKHEGKRIRGKQMVEVMNALGVEWVVFGNHEFDYSDPADLQARLDESNFTWMAANARYKTKTWTMQFFKNRNGGQEICPDYLTRTFKDADGTTLELGVFAVMINSGQQPYVEYSDWAAAAQRCYDALAPKTDVCIAMTHLAIDEDKKLAKMFPKLPLVMGGHEHENARVPVGDVIIAKADANARTVYVHTLRYDKNQKTCTLRSELKNVNATISDEPSTAAVVAKWEKIKNDSLASAGFAPYKLVRKLDQPLDCRESTIRNQQAPVGAMLTAAMLAVARHKPVCSLVNSGSMRVDDKLTGSLSELDVLRILPFGGALVEVEMKGSLLRRTMNASEGNRGGGGYLQYAGIQKTETAKGEIDWQVAGRPLNDNDIYRVVLGEFLLTGKEHGMAFLKTESKPEGPGTTNPEVLSLLKPAPGDNTDLRRDIRLAFIQYLRGQ